MLIDSTILLLRLVNSVAKLLALWSYNTLIPEKGKEENHTQETISYSPFYKQVVCRSDKNFYIQTWDNFHSCANYDKCS